LRRLTTFAFKNLPGFDFQEVNYDTNAAGTALEFNFTNISGTPVIVGSTLRFEQIPDAATNIFNTSVTTRNGTVDTFAALLVGGLLFGIGDLQDEPGNVQIGIGRITATTTTTLGALALEIKVTSPFNATTTNLRGAEWVITGPAISVARGWPQLITFYQGRTTIGGAQSLPQTMMLSKSEDLANFDVGTGEPTDAIIDSLGDGGADHIVNVVASQSLQIFTSGGEYAVPQLNSDGLTPGNTGFRQQSNNGSEQVKPAVVDNQTLYVKKGGKSVMSYTYTQDSDSYASTNISLLSNQLILTPVAMGIRKASSESQEDYMIVINDDGSLAIWQTVQDQNINAWTPSQTQGEFFRITNTEEDVYFVVKRTINSLEKFYIEKLDFKVRTDCTFLSPPGFNANTTTIPELSAETVQIRGNPDQEIFGDGNVNVFPEITASGAGVLNFVDPDNDPITLKSYEIGFGFSTRLRPLAVHINAQDGDNLYRKKRLVKIYLQLKDSLGVKVNGIDVPFKKFTSIPPPGNPPFTPSQPETDLFILNNLAGWARFQSVDITQTGPFPMTVLGVAYEMALS